MKLNQQVRFCEAQEILLTKTGSQKDWWGYKHCWTGRRRGHVIISADRSISDSADRVTEMFQNTLAFSGITGAVDLFQAPAENNEIPIASTVSATGPVEFESTPILESPGVEIPTTYTRKTNCFNRWLYSQHSYS